LLSACFLNDNKQIYIASSNENEGLVEKIKVFDLNGNVVKEIENIIVMLIILIFIMIIKIQKYIF